MSRDALPSDGSVNLPSRGLAGILASLPWRQCPACGAIRIIRSSWRVGEQRYARLLCRQCGRLDTKCVYVHESGSLEVIPAGK
jgi:hypothetical protein